MTLCSINQEPPAVHLLTTLIGLVNEIVNKIRELAYQYSVLPKTITVTAFAVLRHWREEVVCLS